MRNDLVSREKIGAFVPDVEEVGLVRAHCPVTDAILRHNRAELWLIASITLARTQPLVVQPAMTRVSMRFAIKRVARWVPKNADAYSGLQSI